MSVGPLSQERIYKVLVAPLVSEKSTDLAEHHNTVAFQVATDATKSQITRAVEALFGVSVTGVSTVNVKGKVKRFGKSMGRRSDWKKAYVRLAEGQEIDFTSGAQ